MSWRIFVIILQTAGAYSMIGKIIEGSDNGWHWIIAIVLILGILWNWNSIDNEYNDLRRRAK